MLNAKQRLGYFYNCSVTVSSSNQPSFKLKDDRFHYSAAPYTEALFAIWLNL